MKNIAKAPRDQTLVNRVRAAFEGVSSVKEKQMFGSTAFMVRGKMCVSARAERIMCRIDPALHDDLVKRQGCRTVVMGGRRYRGYVYVDADAIGTKRALTYWIEHALKYNEAQNQKTGGGSRSQPATGRKNYEGVSRRGAKETKR
ncbi:MAG TPA: TfoX/Sxy family protein [Lacunisphaera sp.]|jgi:TfoX/Sxy family transcriptional regulator of competence genes